MRETFISIITALAIVSVRCSTVGKDGFNFYKDYLRARPDEVLPEDPAGDRMLYLYRAPVQLYPGLLPGIEQEYWKRTGNEFKNHMLSKESVRQTSAPEKRGSKTALALMLQGQQRPYQGASYIGDNVESAAE